MGIRGLRRNYTHILQGCGQGLIKSGHEQDMAGYPPVFCSGGPGVRAPLSLLPHRPSVPAQQLCFVSRKNTQKPKFTRNITAMLPFTYRLPLFKIPQQGQVYTPELQYGWMVLLARAPWLSKVFWRTSQKRSKFLNKKGTYLCPTVTHQVTQQGVLWLPLQKGRGNLGVVGD